MTVKRKKLKKEPLILNIESATGSCSVCVSKGTEILCFQEASEAYQHAKVLTSLINECLSTGGLTLEEMDAIAVSSGPGSYTSLRVGISTAKGICYALGKPLISVDTLQALALTGMQADGIEGDYYCPMIDARRMEVYCNLFDKSNHPISESVAIVVGADSFAQYFESEKTIVFCGNGAEKCKNVLVSPNAKFYPSECSAVYLPAISSERYKEGKFEDVAYFTPTYLKPPNITIPKNMNHLKALKIP